MQCIFKSREGAALLRDATPFSTNDLTLYFLKPFDVVELGIRRHTQSIVLHRSCCHHKVFTDDLGAEIKIHSIADRVSKQVHGHNMKTTPLIACLQQHIGVDKGKAPGLALLACLVFSSVVTSSLGFSCNVGRS